MTTAYELAFVRREEEPVLAPPRGETGALGWLRANLFSSATNTILTLLSLALLVWVIPPIIRWAFLDAAWTGQDRDACAAPGIGACWAFVEAKFPQFMYGRYPIDERWRVNLTAVLLLIGIVPVAIPQVPFKRGNWIYLAAVFPIVAAILLTGGNFDISVALVALPFVLGAFATGLVAMVVASARSPLLAGKIAPAAVVVGVFVYLASRLLASTAGVAAFGSIAVVIAAIVSLAAGLAGIFGGGAREGASRVATIWFAATAVTVVLAILAFDFGLRHVETQLWGGLLVTLVVALVGIAASMPLGIVLALGRRSRLPVVRMLSIGFIEFVRGVPLITVLFMASVMLPIFLPPGVTFDKLLRALIGVALFASAYMAEVVRGGLQAIPKGQYEAAMAIGFGYSTMMRLIILPQALKIVIPGIVNSFISLFKDTSLVLIIGIFDLLGIVQFNFADSNWVAPGIAATGYVFAATVFWIFCFSMSRYSQFMERRLNTGHKR